MYIDIVHAEVYSGQEPHCGYFTLLPNKRFIFPWKEIVCDDSKFGCHSPIYSLF